MRTSLRVGAALFNDGQYHAAHDAWEDQWLSLGRGSDDERFLHGLIQYTAAVYHLDRANLVGAEGLASTALGYLTGLSDGYRGINLDEIRQMLEEIHDQPESIHPGDATPILFEDNAVGLAALDPEECWLAGEILAEEHPEFDDSVIETAHVLSEHDRDRFATLVQDFVGRADHRPLVYDRLRQHVDRERSRREGVEDLFETDPDS